MRAVIVLTVTLAIGAAAVTISGTAGSEESLSSIVRGGRLYDNWYKEIKEPPPTVPHPAYPADKKYAKDSGASWRCKECYGWDYRGRDGAYSTGGQKFRTMPPLGKVARSDPWQALHMILNGHPAEEMPSLRARCRCWSTSSPTPKRCPPGSSPFERETATVSSIGGPETAGPGSQ